MGPTHSPKNQKENHGGTQWKTNKKRLSAGAESRFAFTESR
jgi:hypothetical protein